MRALREGLPLGHADFFQANQAAINAQASEAFDQEPVVDDDAYDIVELRGYWEEGDCDYFVIAWLAPDGGVDLVTIDFDISPLRIDP